MKKNKQGKSTIVSILIMLFTFLLVLVVILLPFYYKVIWPPIIGEPAKASTVDILAFWGAVFGGIITLVGVLLSVRFSQKEIQYTMHQQDKDQFIQGFGSTVLEINSISYEIKKFRDYLNQYKKNIVEYSHTKKFKAVSVKFDVKEDYKKIQDQHKPDLEIVCNRFEGKAAHANGLVYHYVTILTADIRTFQKQLHDVVENFNNNNDKKNGEEKLASILERIYQSLAICEMEINNHKEELGETFKQYAKEDGLL
ncbi:hypothetical protein [Metabacillus malikii]|uniref:Flagellar basal body-associated protein FliL n=1 Tax=Metabacillus malikii TaxID=1504265 RepID=A0ABT9ZI81_9BACI|nr:hypothetical protein [Metabacillus malikii]MDQ0230915.1 flagellar basal body-associated protein FliL [Metabacillus malikii]